MKSNSDFFQEHLKFKPDEVFLKPMKAQVGGHVYMQILNDQYVCKPLNERELQFYQNIPKNLEDLVPAFQGTLVGKEDSSGNKRFRI
jgi:inositol-hexakisphosphate kinase